MTWRRYPHWAFQGKSPTKLPTDNMIARDEMIKEKAENLKNNKNITDKDIMGDVINSYAKVKNRGRNIFTYRKPYDYAVRRVLEEAERSLHDALCVVRNMLKNNKIVYGGGATEVACSLFVADKADATASIDQYAIRAYAEALEVIPISLAENSGYNGIEYLANLKAKQKKEKNFIKSGMKLKN